MESKTAKDKYAYEKEMKEIFFKLNLIYKNYDNFYYFLINFL